jgi:hypothetical protein
MGIDLADQLSERDYIMDLIHMECDHPTSNGPRPRRDEK